MEDVVVGILAILFGAVFCFWGYFAMRIAIPIWGFFAGFMLGAGATAAFVRKAEHRGRRGPREPEHRTVVCRPTDLAGGVTQDGVCPARDA